MTEWREGRRGAAVMGFRHGLVCLGCCWALMGLLFVAGVMNLVWVAVLAALVLGQKRLPVGRRAGWVTGVLLLAGGAAMLVRQAL